MPRFVLLYHECPPGFERPSHWDLMLQAGDALRTWALVQLPRGWQAAREQTAISWPDCPPAADSNAVEAEQLDDHRLAYLEYEGPLSGDRGRVTQIDTGTFTTTDDIGDIGEFRGNWHVELSGVRLRGPISLSESSSGHRKWTLACGEGH